MPKGISSALNGTQWQGSGWIDASSLAGNAPRRFELGSQASAGAHVEVWASNDNTGATSYTGQPSTPGSMPPTPPSGRPIGVLIGASSFVVVYPFVGLSPNGAPGGIVNPGCQALFYNFIRITPDVETANVILSGEIAAGNVDPGTGDSRKASFSASASLLNEAAQFIPPSGSTTSLTANLGVLQESAGTLSELVFAFAGDAANEGGQVATFTLLRNGVPIATTPAWSTTGGSHGGTFTFGPSPVAVGDILTCEVTISVNQLSRPLTNVYATVK